MTACAGYQQCGMSANKEGGAARMGRVCRSHMPKQKFSGFVPAYASMPEPRRA
jgi:hypothetical protein